MSSHEASRHSTALLVVLALILMAAVIGELQLRLQPYLEDDAYIHLRVARNLATHGAPYFNLDEPVAASSAPLWTVLLALGLALGLGGGAATTLLSTLSTTVAAGLATQVVAGDDRRPWLSGWGLAGAVLTVAVVLPTACQGMETPLVAALLTAGLALAQRRRPAALLVLALACAVRVEMIVPFAAVALWALVSWPGRRRALLLAVVGFAPLVVYDLVFFGTLIPHAAVAKSKLYALSLARVASDLAVALVPLPNGLPASRGPVQAGILTVLACLVVVLVAARTRAKPVPPPLDPVFVVALGSGVVIAAAYLWRHVFVHAWYPPLVLLPAGLGLLGVLRWVGGRAATGLAALAIVPLLIPAAQTVAGAVNPAAMPWFRQVARARAYEQLGRDLAQRFPDATMVAAEIGGLGWGFPGPVRDGTGIASPAALKWHPMPVPAERSRGDIGAVPPGYVEQLRPELIVSHPHFLEAVLASPVSAEYVRFSAPLFLADDARRMEWPGLWGSSGIVVLVRRDRGARSR